MAYSYSLIRIPPLVPHFPSFGNLDKMYCSEAAANPKRNTRTKLNVYNTTAKVTACAYDYKLIVFNIITVYVTCTLFPLLLGAGGFEAGQPASKPAGWVRNWLEVANQAVTYTYISFSPSLFLSLSLSLYLCISLFSSLLSVYSRRQKNVSVS